MQAPTGDPTRSRDARVAAAYYDSYAEKYDAAVDGQEANLRLRAAFQERVAAVAGTHGTVLDFGCGTGTDALWYAARGNRVIAYDISVEMLTALQRRCAEPIATGRVVVVAGDLSALLPVLEREGPVAAVAANFASVNHIGDLAPLFAALAPHVVSGGAIVASLLNPIAAGDIRRRWWWRGALRSPFSGSIRLDGLVTTYRHFERTVRRAARPGFELVSWESTADIADGRRRRGLRRRLASGFVFATLRRT